MWSTCTIYNLIGTGFQVFLNGKLVWFLELVFWKYKNKIIFLKKTETENLKLFTPKWTYPLCRAGQQLVMECQKQKAIQTERLGWQVE